ncbi:MAG: bifunctional diaminohydroxyphosphoribosylaminopyrimidine deaminase/5-amino-6-(5-phosphoribosylamino)uracil reductase RibD [Pseudomonadota bacterium]
MAVAIALGGRSCALSQPNPNVGCVIVKAGRIIGRGWTQPGGRPHAEAMALAEAGAEAHGATAYVSLEPCAHASPRGPSCAGLLTIAGIARVVIGRTDPDPRTNGKGIAALKAAGVSVDSDVMVDAASASMAGWLMQMAQKRPFITLKLATSLDGCIATVSGQSQWITSEAARAHGHVMRSRSNLIIIGRGTYDADTPKLDVRLAGVEARSPVRAILSTKGETPQGWERLDRPEAIIGHSAHYALIEGGAGAASAFLKCNLVDRLLLYRAPILIGGGKRCLGDIGLESLAHAHGCWRLHDARKFGDDRLEVYDRVRGV